VIDRAVVSGAGRAAYHGCSAVISGMLGSVESINRWRNTVECEREEDEEVRRNVSRLPERVR
jgi:hypothetical protein